MFPQIRSWRAFILFIAALREDYCTASSKESRVNQSQKTSTALGGNAANKSFFILVLVLVPAPKLDLPEPFNHFFAFFCSRHVAFERFIEAFRIVLVVP